MFPDLIGYGRIQLPAPDMLSEIGTVDLTADQRTALQAIFKLPFDASQDEFQHLVEHAVAQFPQANRQATQPLVRPQKFDHFDEFFEVDRVTENAAEAYIVGLLLSYANVLRSIKLDQSLTVTELPLLRMALESSLSLFIN